MKTSLTRVITAHVPAEMAEKIDEMAASYDRSRGWIVKQALAAIIEQEENHHQMILEGLADVDAKHVVEHSEVLKWANSLGSETPLSAPRSGHK